MLQVHYKLSGRLFLVLMLLAVGPVCVVGYQAYHAAQLALTKTAFLHMSTIALDHANHLQSWLKERADDIQSLAELPLVRAYCGECCSLTTPGAFKADRVSVLDGIISLTRRKSPSFQSIHLLTAEGQVIASTDPSSEDAANFKQSPILLRLRQGPEPTLSSIHQHQDGTWTMHLVAQIPVAGNLPSSYVLAVLDVSKTIDPIVTDRVGLGESGETYLVDNEGRIISDVRGLTPAQRFGGRFETFGIQSALKGEQGVAIYNNYAGQEVVGAYFWMPRFEWGLLAEIGKDEIMAPLKAIGVTVALAVAGLSLLSLLLAFVVSRRVSRPISQMADAARKMADGNLQQAVPYSGADEVGTLAESFNIMAQRLASLISSLYQKEQSLAEAYDQLLTAQGQLVRTEKMAAIGDLITSVVHEMRNPLSSIKLNLQIIGRFLAKEEPVSEHYRIALDQAVQLENMFSDLLNYSKPLVLQKKPVDILDVIERSLMQLRGSFLEQEIKVDRQLRMTLPNVVGDADKILQVLGNVIKNAAEACGREGTITIGAAVSESAGKLYVAVVISDNGPGIQPQQLRRVFQPFFTTKKKGTGLGLAIVKKIMEAHGGEVWLKSENGRGTMVELRFPLS
jgi:signal transduction histidine kinase